MDENFCSRLVAALAERDISRNELVKRGYDGLTYRKVHAYCTGESSPPMEFLTLLGQMGFDLSHLILGTPVQNMGPGVATGALPASADLLAQLAQALRTTQQALSQLAPLAANTVGENLPHLTLAQLSGAERLTIERLRAQPEKQELILAMLTPCQRCAAQDGLVA
jgi:hypothetical protein